MKLQYRVLDPRLGDNIPLPHYATDGSAGLDLRAMVKEPLTLAPGDTLVPSWYEAWAGVTVSDNSGTHVIDLYGWRDDGVDNLLVHWAADEGTGEDTPPQR